MQLALAPGMSTFVVFRGAPAAHRRDAGAAAVREWVQLSGPWTVRFGQDRRSSAKNWSALRSWTTSADPAVRFFSGTASYTSAFTLAAPPSPGTTVLLDLSTVADLASIRINGKSAGTVWTRPYRLDVGQMLRRGRNTISIDVANTWHNRIVGIKNGQPADDFFTTASTDLITAKTPLLPAGLIGPVRLIELRYPEPRRP